MTTDHRFELTRLAIGQHPSERLSPDEFKQVKDARSGIIALLYIEEKFALLVENFVEFESALLQLALRNSMFGGVTWDSMLNDSMSVARRLVNLLSTGRLYIDQALHDVSQNFGHDLHRQLDAQFSSQYDSSLGYRAMNELRNYTQHKGLPIDGLGYTHHIESDPSFRIRVSTEPTLSFESLRGNFKKTVLSDLERLGDQIKVVPLVREYMHALGNVHEWLRHNTHAKYEQWSSVLARLFERARILFPNDLTGVGIVELDLSDHHYYSAYLNEDWRKRIDALRVQNRNFSHFESHYVSEM